MSTSTATTPRTWIDNLALLQDLFPKWEPSASEGAMFTDRLAHHDQLAVKRAIEQHKVRSGRYNTPTIEGILGELPARESHAQPEAGTWEGFLQRLPDERLRLVTLYDRIAKSGSAAQFDRVKRFISWIGDSAVLWRNPLDLEPTAIIGDRELYPLLRRWIDFLEQLEQPVTDAQRAAARASLREAQRRIFGHVDAGLRPVNLLARHKLLTEQALQCATANEEAGAVSGGVGS